MHLLALGMFLFELRTLAYDQLQRRTSWQHARAARIGARDATQYTGPGEDSISLSGTVYAEIADGPVSLDQLREMAADGEALPLVDGAGKVHGDFIILAVDERQAFLMADGTPRRIDFAIDLLRVDSTAGGGGA